MDNCVKQARGKNNPQASLPGLRDSDSRQIEAIILSTLTAAEGETFLHAIDASVENGTRDEATVRATITRLLAEGKIELTRLRRLRASSSTRSANQQNLTSNTKAAAARGGL